MALLEVDGLRLEFGGLVALDDVGFAVEAGEVCGLVGPNGAGKTSLFNCVCGLYRPTAGTITVDGVDALAGAPHRLSSLGVARTFQHPVLQPDTSVLENVLVGAHSRTRPRFGASLLRAPGLRRAERELAEEARALLERLGIGDQADLPGGELSYGQSKRVELARALLSRPRLLLLDELASGLVHEEVRALGELIARIRDEDGVAILLVEHHMELVAAVCDKVVVLVQGKKVVEGSAEETQRHPVVVEAYLGQAA